MPLREYQIDLINNVRNSYRHGNKAPCIVLPCGGGKSIIVAEMAKKTTEKGNRVLFIVHRKELCDQIRNTFTRWGVDMALCQIGMVQTVCRHLDKMPAPSLIITDENHHAKADSYTKIYKAFPKAYKIGVTATPVRLDGSGLKGVNDDLIIGVSAKWLIENQFLAPYDYFAPTLADLKGIKTVKGDFDAKQSEEKLMKRAIFGDVIAYYNKLAKGKQAICYCTTVKHSKTMASIFIENGITAAHLDGTTPRNERDEVIEKFRKGEIKILCNVDLISEGFDVPDCECAILLRPTKSLTLYIQQSMRCMRYKPHKTAVIIDHVGNYARHGLPDADRQWTLDGRKKQQKDPANPFYTCESCFGIFPKRKNNKPVIACPHCGQRIMTQCSECGAIFPKYLDEDTPVTVCPECGHDLPAKGRTVPDEVREAALQKITDFVVHYDSPQECGSYQELLAYAQRKGYKTGWAWYQAKARGLM